MAAACPRIACENDRFTFRHVDALWTVVAIVDCEALHSGWPQQPINGWSSFAFIAVGALVAFRGRSPPARWVGAAAALVGVGSLLFHGDDRAFDGWLHDWSIAVLLLLLIRFAGANSAARPWEAGPVLAVGVLYWFVPAAGEWVSAGLALTVGVRELMEWRTRAIRPMVSAFVLAGAAGMLTILGRTGGVWCSPDTVLQPHAGWHILAASALGLYASARGWLAWGPRPPDAAWRFT